MKNNLYNELSLPFDATADEIRSAYFQAAKLSHPDTNGAAATRERFLRVQEAFQTLSDPKKRAEYDATLPESLKEPVPIDINVLYSLPGLPRLKEDQRLYAILEVQTSSAALSIRPPVHVCLVIDCSTSMQGERLQQIKYSLGQILPLLQPSDVVSVVAFSDLASVIVPPTPAARTDIIETSIRSLTAHGATEIYQGLRAGY
ncbi:MAG TPA: DnaJ domain-containing protein, partial [Anaerolineaceae bacterium]|nr:DnaJ domain-containing protein [Anaerolineaceae bacterium]